MGTSDGSGASVVVYMTPPEPFRVIRPDSDISDPEYWASISAEAGMSAAEWDDLERRETGATVHATPEAHAKAGPDILYILTDGWDEAAIPPRPWIAKGYMMRGAVTVLSGPGSAGKSSLVVAWCAALALGQSFHHLHSPKPVRVATYNVEDDENEQKRRFSAVFRQLSATPYDTNNLAIIGPRSVGTLLTFLRDGQILVNTPVMDKLEEFVTQFQPDILFLDPFVELHQADENDNTAIRAVMARFRFIAITYNIAVVVLHHSRKGLASPGDPDSLRGASAIVGAARVALTINTMTEDEAKSFGLPPDSRRNFFRLDGAKSNYAPIEEAEWFQRIEYTLDNGDGVAAATPWTPPAETITTTTLDAVKTDLEKGFQGEPYCYRKGAPRSIDNLLTEKHSITTPAGREEIANLLKHDGWDEWDYIRPNRNKAKGIRSPAKLPPAAWCDLKKGIL